MSEGFVKVNMLHNEHSAICLNACWVAAQQRLVSIHTVEK